MEKLPKTQTKPTENLVKTSENPEKPISDTTGRKLGGRPKKDISDIKKKEIDDYLSRTGSTKTFAGIARHLGYKSTLDFIADAKKNGGYLGYALSRIEEQYEIALLGRGSTGAIFALKQVGWADTQKVETEVKAVSVNISLSASLDELTQKLMPVMEEVV